MISNTSNNPRQGSKVQRPCSILVVTCNMTDMVVNQTAIVVGLREFQIHKVSILMLITTAVKCTTRATAWNL